MQILFIVLAVLAVLIGCARYVRGRKKRAAGPSASRKQTLALSRARQPAASTPPASPVSQAAAQSPSAQETPSSSTPSSNPEVQFRKRGERGEGGPVYGDVLCSDGVYLPQVWESDFHTSFDGRWIRTGSYGGASPRLIDRKHRRAWCLSAQEAAQLEALHWQLPRWDAPADQRNGFAADASQVLSDSVFDTWLSQHIRQPAQALVGVCDLWIPADCVPSAAQAVPPQIPQPDNAAVQVSLQRYWPTSLRDLAQPLEVLQHPHWQLQLNGMEHAWVMEGGSTLVWRPDGQAFACYGYPANGAWKPSALRLGVWSLGLGGQQWSQWQPQDHKAWEVSLPPSAAPASTTTTPTVIAASAPPALRWDGADVLQRVYIDTPILERLHDGRSLRSTMHTVYAASKHREDGRVLLKPVPQRHFVWRRDMHHPTRWMAHSEPVAGQSLQWNLVHEATDQPGATAAYTVQWGDQQLPGLWELEHCVVDGQWALLLAWRTSPWQADKAALWVWDGYQLNAVDLPWPVVRLRPHVRSGRAQLLAMVGCGADNSNLSGSGMWRWPLQAADSSHLAKAGWSAAYAWRDIAVDAAGVWQLQARWRTVQQVQHPAADGDYVWHHPAAQDAIWWWGGVHTEDNHGWKPKAARCDGVLVTQSGAVLCGVGPSVCPHFAGEGWAALEWVARGEAEQPNHWKLHWLQPHKRQVLTLELRAHLPVLQAWSAYQGLQWVDAGAPAGGETQTSSEWQTTELVIAPMRWESASLTLLKSTSEGLWMRKQDLVYADAVWLRDDWPWTRAVSTPS